MKIYRWTTSSILLISVVLGLASSSPATTYQYSDLIHVSGLHQIEDDFYAFANDIKIDGTITGDLIGGSTRTTIKGNILGSANLVGQSADHNGSITGSLRFLGDRLTVGGRVGSSILAAGRQVVLNQGSVVEKDVTLAAGDISLDGNILGKVNCKAGMITITGQIGGDVYLKAEKILVAPPAVIRGDLVYIAEREDQLTMEPGVTVIGTTSWQLPEAKENDESNVARDIAYRIASMLAAFFFGVIVISLFKAYAEESFTQLQRRFTVTVAAGLLGMLALLLAVLVLALSLMGTLLGSILLSGDQAVVGVALLVLSTLLIPITSFITVAGAVAFYTGKIIIGLVIGYLILKPLRREAAPLSKLSLLLGLVILSGACALPYVGFIIFLLTGLIGAGAIILGIHNCRKG